MTTIQNVEFIKGIRGTDPILHDGIPHVAFVGRSNVGKSSVINTLINCKNFVKSSSTPGKTREINFFRVNDQSDAPSYFVDLPGYGYAKGTPRGHERIQKMILWYLTEAEVTPKLVVLIVDALVGPSKQDHVMLDILRDTGHPFVVLANKIDKLKKNDVRKSIEQFEREFFDHVVPFSAKSRLGKEEVLNLALQ